MTDTFVEPESFDEPTAAPVVLQPIAEVAEVPVVDTVSPTSSEEPVLHTYSR